MNQQGLSRRSVVTVQSVPQGMAEILNQLDGLYTLLLRGLHKNAPYEEQEIIASITCAIDAYRDFRGVLNCAENPDPRFVISNTTEAGIECKADDLCRTKGRFFMVSLL